MVSNRAVDAVSRIRLKKKHIYNEINKTLAAVVLNMKLTAVNTGEATATGAAAYSAGAGA